MLLGVAVLLRHYEKEEEQMLRVVWLTLYW